MVLPSEAVTYTILAQRPRPTLLLDEADAILVHGQLRDTGPPRDPE
jgi:hypothetical protein